MSILKLIQDKSSDDFEIEAGKLYTFLNPYSYLISRNNIDIFKEFDVINCDGILLCKLVNVFGINRISRFSFDMTSVAKEVFKYCEQRNLSIAIIGTKEEFIKPAIENILASYDLRIVLFRNGYFHNQDELENFQKDLVAINPAVVIVGMGALLQEKFLLQLRQKGWQGIGFTCGGFLHQTASNILYYPKWIDTIHMRWLYRIYKEPELFKRYTIDYITFGFLFIKDYLKFKK